MKIFKKDTKISWKDKAKGRREENKKLQKRIQELTTSRNKWKTKYQKTQEERIADKKNEEV